MFGVIVAAFGRLVGWFFGAGVVKWGFVAVLFGGIALLLELLIDLLPAWFTADGLSGATSAFTPEMWYFIDYFQLSTGISLVLSAYAVRFLIRRIPFIG